jgi:hypothetical protein
MQLERIQWWQTIIIAPCVDSTPDEAPFECGRQRITLGSSDRTTVLTSLQRGDGCALCLIVQRSGQFAEMLDRRSLGAGPGQQRTGLGRNVAGARGTQKCLLQLP